MEKGSWMNDILLGLEGQSQVQSQQMGGGEFAGIVFSGS